MKASFHRELEPSSLRPHPSTVWLGRVDDYRTAMLGLLAQPTPEFSQILEAAR